MNHLRNIIVFSFLWIFIQFNTQAQTIDSSQQKLKPFEKAPKFHKVRFGVLTGSLLTTYSATVIGLDRAWYANYPRGKFQFFNDWHEWRYMDKMGHAMTAYFESKWVGDMYQWAGIPQKQTQWIGFGAGMLFQSSLEMLDGFSTQWGFSWGDMAFNTIGSGMYLGQELLWKEQRIKLKMSTHRPNYSILPIQASNSTATTTLRDRAASLYGTSLPELFFKEYNGQTIWMSANIASFCKTKPKWLPAWVNVAVGYGIQDVYGARSNSWTNSDGDIFMAPSSYQPYSQYYLSLDIDFERIKTRHRWLRVLFGFLNIFKVPFPALEVNTKGGVHFRPFHF